MAKMNPGGLVSRMAQAEKLMTFECGIHELSYKSHRAGCPACESERALRDLRRANQELSGKLEIAYGELQKLRVQTDIVSAIREAADILDDNDMAFLKSVLYEWRDTKSLAIKTTHGAGLKSRRGKRPAPNGFIVMPRKGDPYGHICSSVGGLAIAEYYDEATNTVGGARAMEFLVKGMSIHLPGALR